MPLRTSKYKILFVSRDDFLKTALSEQFLQQFDYEKLSFAANDDALEIISQDHFDGFIIDLENLDKDIFVSKLSEEDQKKPMFFLMGNNSSGNIASSLLSDAQDDSNYIRHIIYRPFELEDFFDILKTSLNKYEKGAGSIVKIGEFRLDQGQRQLTDDKGEIITKLTEKEVDILRHLFKNKNLPIKKEKLLEQVWGYSPEMDTHTLETHIYRLRQKIKDMAKYLITDDKGYSITIDDEQC
ncbi:MAG: winged-helix domain-containing protein [Alphaproteobacteria bacterium]